jgi:feruloyl esterase
MRRGLLAVSAIVGFVTTAASARAAALCDVVALNALQVPNVGITEAKPVAAAGRKPAYCEVQGTVVTKGEGVDNGIARFAMQLPDSWQQRFLFVGVGGNAGNFEPSANPKDLGLALGKGYATILTDTGHVGDGVTARWAQLPNGTPNAVTRIDFAYRAAHDVTLSGKAFTEAYYAAKIEHSYFDGCSTGGRMAMMEADRYPTDYEGVISGDPLLSNITSAARAVIQKAALSSPDAYIPESTIKAIDARVTAQCDLIDGARDGLVQNPAACPIHAEDLLCRAGEVGDCLNNAQVRVLKSFTSPFHDSHGHVIFGPWAITDLSGPRGLAFHTVGETAPDLSDLASPWKASPRLRTY